MDNYVHAKPAPIERFGHKWQLTMQDLAEIKQQIEMPSEPHRLLMSMIDVLRWCSGPEGLSITLRRACMSDGVADEVLAQLPPGQQMELLSDLTGAFLGPDDDKEINDG